MAHNDCACSMTTCDVAPQPLCICGTWQRCMLHSQLKQFASQLEQLSVFWLQSLYPEDIARCMQLFEQKSCLDAR